MYYLKYSGSREDVINKIKEITGLNFRDSALIWDLFRDNPELLESDELTKQFRVDENQSPENMALRIPYIKCDINIKVTSIIFNCDICKSMCSRVHEVGDSVFDSIVSEW